MDDIHKNIEDYNPEKKCKVLIVFDYIIPDMIDLYEGRKLVFCF